LPSVTRFQDRGEAGVAENTLIPCRQASFIFQNNPAKGEKKVEDTSSCESSLENSMKRNWKEVDAATEVEPGNEKKNLMLEAPFRGIMSKREMEILMAWFPKCAQTLAAVLRNHDQISKRMDRFCIDDER
jgi:hypothetical protein